MKRDLKEFINEALCQPNDFLPYFVSQKLAEWYPESAILENESWMFDLREYAAAGLCSMWPQEPVHCQVETTWCRSDNAFEQELENGWYSILWPDCEAGGREHLIDVVQLTWINAGSETTRRWIVAETREAAEKFLRAVCEYGVEVHGEILVYEDGYWRKDDKLFASIKGATFDNLILPPQLKQELREDFRRFFASREVYERYGIPWKRGALLIGPPGNGKTHTIKALINELNLPCLYVKSFSSSSKTEQSCMRAVFARARHCAPCLVVLEDLDTLVGKKSRAFLLNEMDGFADNHGVAVIASTNHPKKLDAAILERPSRFDRKYHFTAPATPERLAYCKVWNRTLQAELQLNDAELAGLVERTNGFSFAYLKELFLSAMMQWVVEQRPSTMGAILLEQAALLREQIKATKPPKASEAAAGLRK